MAEIIVEGIGCAGQSRTPHVAIGFCYFSACDYWPGSWRHLSPMLEFALRFRVHPVASGALALLLGILLLGAKISSIYLSTTLLLSNLQERFKWKAIQHLLFRL